MKQIGLILYLLSTATYASIAPGQWQCIAFDAQKNAYPAQSMTMNEAMHAADRSCQKQSKQQRCKTAQSFCEQGPLSLIEDRCVVADNHGRTWNATGENACKTALSLCTEWQFLNGKMSQCAIKHR